MARHLLLLIFFWPVCMTQIHLNSTMKKYMKKIGREMFGLGSKTTEAPFGSDNTDSVSQSTHFGHANSNDGETVTIWQNLEEEFKNKAKKERKKKNKKLRVKKNKIQETIGPAGPQGPAGKEGSHVPQLLSQMRKMLRTTNLKTSLKSGGNNYLAQMATYGVPDILVGFAAMTKKNTVVSTKSTIEVTNFDVTIPGCFLRGSTFYADTGHFMAPITAVYSFHAVLHISLPKDLQDLLRKDYVTVSLCLDGDIKNRVMSVTEGMGTNSRMFSININGYLYLQAGQRVSLFIHNNSPKHNVIITRNSYFTGILVGT